jgi:hypothetical protein
MTEEQLRWRASHHSIDADGRCSMNPSNLAIRISTDLPSPSVNFHDALYFMRDVRALGHASILPVINFKSAFIPLSGKLWTVSDTKCHRDIDFKMRDLS